MSHIYALFNIFQVNVEFLRITTKPTAIKVPVTDGPLLRQADAGLPEQRKS